MKTEFLKMAGVKSESAFYKKYPTEEAFFKAHPQAKKMIKKAQTGMMVPPQMQSYLQSMNSVPNMQNVMQGQMQSQGVNAGMFPGYGANAPGTANAWDIDTNQVPDLLQGPGGPMGPYNNNLNITTTPPKPGIGESLNKFAPMAGELIEGYGNLRAGRRNRLAAQQMAKLTGVQAEAAETRPEEYDRMYLRPEDVAMTGEERFPIYGMGTNALAKNGARLESGGEIQNTYAPGTLYDDLEFVPLTNPNQQKTYRVGGSIPKAFKGMNMMGGGGTPWESIGSLGSSFAGSMTGNDGGGQIGGAIGGTAGMLIGGPAGQAIGSTVGTLAGGLLDKNDNDQRKAEADIKYNIGRMKNSQYGKANQSYLSSIGVAENGINVNPQIISQFGENNLMSLLAPPNDADMLRAGGHIRGSYVAPNESGLSTMEEGGELSTHWGGYAEPMSNNPYLPDGGEVVMFRGNSHEESDGQGNTGIGITFGDSPVEVERGEPAVKLKDGGTSEDNLVVFGNLIEPSSKRKFKNVVADIAKKQEKENKLIDKSMNDLTGLKIVDSFDKLKMESLKKNIEGGNMKLKKYADDINDLAAKQSAINDTAEEYGIDADALSKGKVKVDRKAMKLRNAMFGTAISKFEEGGELPKLKEEDYAYIKGLYEKANKTKNKADVLKFQQEYHRLAPEYAKKVIGSEPVTTLGKQKGLSNKDLSSNEDGLFGKRTIQYMSELDNSMKKRERSADLENPKITTTPADQQSKEDAVFDVTPLERNKWIDILGQALPFIRPSDAEGLDANQLLGETFAMSTNQVVPVQAIGYRPELDVPFDISFQDQLNEITASERGAQRMAGYNPALGAAIAGQAYGAKSSVLANQFRANQAMKDQVYARNRATLNDAQLKNLAIADQQFMRQQGALSATKATAQEALNSIAAKYAQNRLENRTLQTYENLYNYRFGPNFRAMNMNAPQQFDTGVVYSPSGEPNYRKVTDKQGRVTFEPINSAPINSAQQPSSSTSEVMPMSPAINPFNKQEEKEEGKKNGGSIKKATNGSVVKMFKM
jgi:hypothetical protein